MTLNPVHDAINKLDGAIADLDSGRFALAFLLETARPDDHSADVIQCVLNTLGDAAGDAQAGLDVVYEALRDKSFTTLAEVHP